MRYLIAIAVMASAACSLKFPSKDEGTFACKQDSDCISPFICKGNVCVNLHGAPRCNPPTITATSSPTTSQYVGFSYSLSGTAESADPTCPLGTDTAWMVCDAPAGSTFAATDGTNCTHLADGNTATFTPDVHGTYNLKLHATAGDAAGDGVVPLTILADALFLEMSYVDSRTTQALIRAQFSSGCYDFDQPTCATHPECMWSAAYQTCWTQCTGLAQTDCNNHYGQCSYNSSTPSCDTGLTSQQNACIVHTTAATCTANSRCVFADTIGICHEDCSALTTETDCTNAQCTWDAVSSTCSGNQDLTSAGFSETTIAQLYTDGSQVAPLYYGGQAQYRYDPNTIFTDVLLGTGMSAITFGLAYDPVTRIALVPHYYIYQTPPVSGQLQCRGSMDLIVWRQGDTFGRPLTGGVQPLIQPNPNITDTTATVYSHVVGYPRLVTRTNGSVRFVYGDAKSTVDLTSGSSNASCTAPDGTSTVGAAYALLPLVSASLTGPLVSRTPMPLFIGEAGNNNALTSKPISVLPTAQPCRTDGDCGTDSTGTKVTCVSTTCSAGFNVEGYLPQLMAKGEALAYSQVSCGTSYGAACSSGEYDLMLSKLVTNATDTAIANTFQLQNMTLISAVPGVAELDAFIPGDIFGNLSSVYYLVSSPQTITVNVSDSGTPGTTTQTLPVFSLHTRTLNWHDATGWTVNPPANTTGDVVINGTINTQTAPTPLSCALDGVANRVVLTQAIIHNPLQFAFSPDGRYLAYADVIVATACENAIFGTGGQLAASAVTGSSLKVIDLTSLTPTPQDLFPASCLTQFNLTQDAQLMPTWVANGAQIVFNSRIGTSNDVVDNRFFRMNIADLGAPDCRLVELSPNGAATQALAAIGPTLKPQGLTLVDSRTGQFACISCAGAGPEGATMFAIVAVAALWRATRRRGSRSV